MINKKLLFSLTATVGIFFSCKQGGDYKTIRDEVVSIHDSVMLNSEQAYSNKRKLDTLVVNLDSLKKMNQALDTAKERREMDNLRKRLEEADNQMTDWMHKFDAEVGEKSNEEATKYFNKEKAKIKSIDSLYLNLLEESNRYISRFNKK